MKRTDTLLAISLIVVAACAPPSRRGTAESATPDAAADVPRPHDGPPVQDAGSVSDAPTPADTASAIGAVDTSEAAPVNVGATDARSAADTRRDVGIASGADARAAEDGGAPARCTGGASCSAGETCTGWCDPGGAGWFGARRCSCSGAKLSCGACALISDGGVPPELALPPCGPGTSPGVACTNEPVCLRRDDAGVRGCQCFGSPSRWRCS